MTVDEFEREVVQAAVQFAYIRQTVVVDKTANTIKLRLYVTQDCFVQIYMECLERPFWAIHLQKVSSAFCL